MARHYRIATPAERDARNERSIEQSGVPPREPELQRQPGRLLLDVDGQVFDVLLQPDRRHAWRWHAWLDGQCVTHGGLEQVWREIQRRRALPLGLRNLS